MIQSLLLPLFSPEITNEKSFIEISNSDYIIDEQPLDLKNCYFLNSDQTGVFEQLKQSIIDLYSHRNDISISSTVINNSINLLSYIPQSIYLKLRESDIYASKYGTIIFDWEISEDDIFSLEIGKDSFGYFIEKDGDIIKEVDFLPIKDITTITNNLNTDLADFYNS